MIWSNGGGSRILVFDECELTLFIPSAYYFWSDGSISDFLQFSFYQHFNCKTEAGRVHTCLKKDKGGFSNEFEDIRSRAQEVLSAV
jgi:hypothetical protein